MRLVGLGLVKNECDVIEQYVRHNLQYLDAFVILDNASTDGTREILDALVGEGLPLRVIDDPVMGYVQAEKMTALLNQVGEEEDPDVVLLLDADEFLLAPSRPALEAAIAALPSGTAGLLGWKTFLYMGASTNVQLRRLYRCRRLLARAQPRIDQDDPMRDDPIRRMIRRRREERPRYFKIVLRRESGAHDWWANLRLAQGYHSAEHILTGVLPAMELEGFALAHFPVRSRNQLQSKIIGGWLAYLAKTPNSAREGMGYQKRDLYQKFMSEGELETLTDSDLEAFSLTYAQIGVEPGPITGENSLEDQLAVSYVRRYAHLGRLDPLVTLARTFERYLTDPRARLLPEQSP